MTKDEKRKRIETMILSTDPEMKTLGVIMYVEELFTDPEDYHAVKQMIVKLPYDGRRPYSRPLRKTMATKVELRIKAQKKYHELKETKILNLKSNNHAQK